MGFHLGGFPRGRVRLQSRGSNNPIFLSDLPATLPVSQGPAGYKVGLTLGGKEGLALGCFCPSLRLLSSGCGDGASSHPSPRRLVSIQSAA